MPISIQSFPFLTSFSNCSPLYPLQKAQIYSKFFLSYLQFFSLSPSKEMIERIWRSFSTLSDGCFQLTLKIMICFQRLYKKSPRLPRLNLEKLYSLFKRRIVYENFRDQILSYRKDGELFYNNYTINSYLTLKNQRFNQLTQHLPEAQRELAAGIATYDAIVDLYVQRFLKIYPELNQICFLPSLRVTALGIAIKIAYDEPTWNSQLRRFLLSSNLNLQTHNQMELAFLKGIDWDLSIEEILIESNMHPTKGSKCSIS